MAYRMDNSRRLFPCHAGEFFGNFSDDHIIGDNEPITPKLLARLDFGRPRPAGGLTVEQLEADGIKGLYLKSDASSRNIVPTYQVPTPPELMEPGQERFYNVDGKPGLNMLGCTRNAVSVVDKFRSEERVR